MAISPSPELAAALTNMKLPPGQLTNSRRLHGLLLNVAEHGGPGEPQYIDDLVSAMALSQMDVLDLLANLLQRLGGSK
ncbi:hypothetical protein [Mycobacterium malmoense]|uniref:hypothetical protein n=1 Tax=Mycobacterium malmoense TaxID=1780 RepID=UPI0011469793|nr:hypothetical protein [Mycobacterium malmoense]